jgi:hypothetical protein
MAKHAMSSDQASLVKRMGHGEEITFNIIFGISSLDSLNLSGASEDCFVKKDNYKRTLKESLDLDFEDYSVSLKSGKTWQFHLGSINEISSIDYIKSNIESVLVNDKYETHWKYSNSFDNQLLSLKSYDFWKNYLKKGNLLCYNDKRGNYTFFKMDSVIDCIRKNFEWRLLETGRIKGDCFIDGKIRKGVITIEYRNEDHKQCLVLGAMGGSGDNANGYRLFLHLKENIPHKLIAI